MTGMESKNVQLAVHKFSSTTGENGKLTMLRQPQQVPELNKQIVRSLRFLSLRHSSSI